MEVEVIDKRLVFKRFKQNGHTLSQAAFNNVIEYLCSQQQENMGDKLNQLIDKINRISILSGDQTSEELVKSCIITSQYNKGYQTFEDIINEKFKESIFSVSPYEFKTKIICIQEIPRSLFQYNPLSKSKVFLRRLERVKSNIKKPQEQTTVGVLFQKFDQSKKQMSLYIQSLNSEVKLDTSEMKSYCPFILDGCIYALKGSQKGKDLVFKVQEIRLPPPNTEEYKFNHFKFRQTFKIAKISVDNFKHKDNVQRKLRSHGVHWLESKGKCPILIIGNITLNAQSIQKIKYILSQVQTIQCIVLMLSKEKHTELDLNFDNRLVYVIPDVEEDGPSAIPRIPIFKYQFKGATVLTNPCKLSLFGSNVVFFNFPINTHLHSKTMIKREEIQSSDKLKNIGQFIFGQGNLAMDIQNYWEQEQYMDIHSNQILMISDGSCPQGQMSLSKGGRIASVGHFQRQSSFILYFPLLEKNQIQLSSLQ